MSKPKDSLKYKTFEGVSMEAIPSKKDTLKQIADRFNSKDYMIVSYEMETQHSGEMESYQVTMVIKSKRNNDEGHLLSLMQKFPDVTVQRIE